MSQTDPTGGEVTKVWKGTDGMTAPVLLYCETAGYPNRDCQGETMYSNTHFATEAQAWESIRANAEAGVKLAGGDVVHMREKLRAAENQAANAAAKYSTVIDGYRRFQRSLEGK